MYLVSNTRERWLPLPARDERGEGWGEGFGNAATTRLTYPSPLPYPHLVVGRGDLLQWQSWYEQDAPGQLHLQALHRAWRSYIGPVLKQRLAMIALVLTMIFALGLVLGVFLPRWAGFSAAPKGYSSAALLQQVKTVSELVTVQYVIEKVVVLEDVKWIAGLGENRVLMIAHGIVKAGLDLSELQPGDLQASGKKVVIKLPSAKIIEAYLDDKSCSSGAGH